MASTVHSISFVYHGYGKITEVNSLNEARFNMVYYFRGFYSTGPEGGRITYIRGIFASWWTGSREGK